MQAVGSQDRAYLWEGGGRGSTWKGTQGRILLLDLGAGYMGGMGWFGWFG